MLGYLTDFLFLLVVLGTAYWIAEKGMVYAAVIFIAILIASLLAITTFEPVANWFNRTYLLSSDFRISSYCYFFIAIGIFSSALGILLWWTQLILPTAPVMSPRLETIGRRVFGILTGYLLASFLLTVILTFPAPLDFWGALAPEAHRRPGPIMRFGPDYQFLSLVEYTCEHASALKGGKWWLDRPVISAQVNGGRWSTYPIRYARWRENR